MLVERNDILPNVAEANGRLNKWERDKEVKQMLFGSSAEQRLSMHPAYPAGHGTVAGAWVTTLKAFFDGDWKLPKTLYLALDGSKLCEWKKCGVSVAGELNKLASNVSIGRNWAGVHYFSDYIERRRHLLKRFLPLTKHCEHCSSIIIIITPLFRPSHCLPALLFCYLLRRRPLQARCEGATVSAPAALLTEAVVFTRKFLLRNSQKN